MKNATKTQQAAINRRITMIRRMRDEHVLEKAQTELREEEMHYTDASKYAEQHYGETYRATVGLDNDWGDY